MIEASSTTTKLSLQALELDVENEVARICAAIQVQVGRILRRRGAVLGLSGGIDSSVTAALCARALGPNKVLGLLMPERDSSPESERLGQVVARWLSIPTLREDIEPALQAVGCYRRRDEALRGVEPRFQPGNRFKLVFNS